MRFLRNRLDNKWQTKKTTLSKNKEILNIKRRETFEVVKVAEKRHIKI